MMILNSLNTVSKQMSTDLNILSKESSCINTVFRPDIRYNVIKV